MSSVHCRGPLPEAVFHVRQHPPTQVFEWLRRGWRDLVAIGWPSYLHGIIVFLSGVLILASTAQTSFLLPGFVSAFVIVGPMLATGLYGLSRKRETGLPVGFRDAVCAWRSGTRCLIRFSLLLFLAGAAWILTSTLLFKLYVNVPITDAEAFLRYAVLQGDHHFLLWTLLGSLGTALVFAAAVIAVPLLLDRDVTTWTAVLTSIRTVGENPVTMVCWAICIAVATGISMATGMLGFIVLYPLIGHASWHAYRDLAEINEQEVPVRPEEND